MLEEFEGDMSQRELERKKSFSDLFSSRFGNVDAKEGIKENTLSWEVTYGRIVITFPKEWEVTSVYAINVEAITGDVHNKDGNSAVLTGSDILHAAKYIEMWDQAFEDPKKIQQALGEKKNS